MSTAGYSGTPLARKLGIKPGFSIALYNQPTYYFDLFDDLPDALVKPDNPEVDSLDFIHLFVTHVEELEKLAPKAMVQLKKNGMLWVSWPKGSSGMETDVNRDIIRDYLLGIGLVDVKVAAVDDTWSGLKFVYRLKDR